MTRHKVLDHLVFQSTGLAMVTLFKVISLFQTVEYVRIDCKNVNIGGSNIEFKTI